MSYLRAAREKANHTQTEAARRIGISRTHLSRLEQGKALATVGQAEAIAEQYGVPILQTGHRYSASQLHRDCGIRPYLMEAVSPDLWRTAYSYWGTALRKTGLSLATFEWMSHYLPGESTHECYSLLQVGAAGAEPFLANPHEWDFDQHPVVDRTGRMLGARVLPGLIYRSEQLDFFLLPQVSLRVDASHVFRLDCLMFVRQGQKIDWVDLEWDASGHDKSKDVYRANKLGMKVIRISGQEIRGGRVLELLVKRCEHLLGPSRTPVPRTPARVLPVLKSTGWRPAAPRR